MGCSSRRRIASRIKGGVAKSMSATHRGNKSGRPKYSSSRQCFTSFVPRRSIISSKSYLTLLLFFSRRKGTNKRGECKTKERFLLFCMLERKYFRRSQRYEYARTCIGCSLFSHVWESPTHRVPSRFPTRGKKACGTKQNLPRHFSVTPLRRYAPQMLRF